MKNIRLGIIGLGSMGRSHAQMIIDGKVPRLALHAVCDNESDLTGFGPVKTYQRSEDLIRSGEVDAVLIATPHYQHTTIGMDALRQGLHVLVEKPISVHKADALKLIAAHRDKKQVFAAMFNQRTDPRYTKLRQLIQSGELGEVRRVNWIITNWFRTQAYYNSGGWRATWAGEGGGVLLNQCPHNLDLLQWLFGMPKSLQAFCAIGRYHEIEVEDDVTAYLEYPNGATGVFVTSTGEAPGTNRLEVTTDRGRVVLEDGRIRWDRTEVPVQRFCNTTSERWSTPPLWKVEIPVEGNGEQHLGILKNFTAAILDKVPLIAPAAEGIHSVELANAMLLSSHLGKRIELPISPVTYAGFLKKRIASSRFKKKVVKIDGPRDMANSFGKP
ncbi:MAG: Gfo/Idh/MocA family oxidoreductase [Candidatus Methylacidiphilales bacterium]|nr:Gfo/Idh/MocA family oxidoreductase [Candidatus Methylacidiphilales bacterium]